MLWHALPPEVNTARLMAGAGPGPMLEAAAGWEALGNAFEAQAVGLAATLVTLQGLWTGAGSERAIAAITPMVAWLNDAASKSQQRAVQASAQAASYLTALAATPSLIDIAVNHITHTVLVTTNFFGINTMPIGVNETDYFVRMWNQAAAAMDIYQEETLANSVFEPLLPMKPIMQPEVGEAVSQAVGGVSRAARQAGSTASGLLAGVAEGVPEVAPSLVSDLDEQAAQLLSQLGQLGPLTGPMQQLIQPIQQLTSLAGQQGGMGRSDMGGTSVGNTSSELGSRELGQLGLFGASPLSNHPLAGGAGPSSGYGLIYSEALPGAAGSEPRTALMSNLIERPNETVPPAAAGAGQGFSTAGGAAPRGLVGGGAQSDADARPGLAAPALVADHSEAGDYEAFDEGDDW
ncbi:PPE family protein [Mycobacterium sp. ML2]